MGSAKAQVRYGYLQSDVMEQSLDSSTVQLMIVKTSTVITFRMLELDVQELHVLKEILDSREAVCPAGV